MQLQKAHPALHINTCSPGYVLTDLTAGMGASKTPEQSNCHVAPLHILFGDDVAHGWYYGSDAVRSPLDVYRGPGDAPYESDSDHDLGSRLRRERVSASSRASSKSYRRLREVRGLRAAVPHCRGSAAGVRRGGAVLGDEWSRVATPRAGARASAPAGATSMVGRVARAAARGRPAARAARKILRPTTRHRSRGPRAEDTSYVATSVAKGEHKSGRRGRPRSRHAIREQRRVLTKGGRKK